MHFLGRLKIYGFFYCEELQVALQPNSPIFPVYIVADLYTKDYVYLTLFFKEGVRLATIPRQVCGEILHT